jgi:hypothetical protein
MSWRIFPTVLPPPPPYFGFGSSNQVYSNSIPVRNEVQPDDDGEAQPSRPYIPDASDSVNFTNFGSAPNDQGASVSMNQITLQPADSIHPGGVSTIYQEFAGDKRFFGAVEALSVVADTFIEFPPTTSISSGVIRQDSSIILHTYGVDNLFLGQGSGVFTSVTSANVGIGSQNLSSLTSGSTNTCVGDQSGVQITSGGGNTCVGKSSGLNITTASSNCCFGLGAGQTLTTGGSNILIGPSTGTGLTTNTRCIEIGDGTLTTPATNRTILGTSLTSSCFIAGIKDSALPDVSFKTVLIDAATNQLYADTPQTFINFSAPVPATDAIGIKWIDYNVAALEIASSNYPGIVDIAAQSWAGIKTFTEAINLFPSNSLGVGTIQQSGVSLLQTHGTNNTFLGQDAGNFTLSGSNDTGVGINALKSVTTSSNCVAVGSNALGVLTTGSGNVAVGNNAGLANVSGQTSVYIGNHAGAQIISSNNNVFIGTYAGYGVTTGGDNVFVGPSAGFSSAATTDHVVEVSNGTMGTSITGDIRIGTSASLKCYIAALSLAVTAPTSMVVYDSASRHVGSASLSSVSANNTATLDVGTITTMTVRGAATTTVPIRCSLLNNIVTMRLPYFSLTAQTGVAFTINLGTIAAQFRPTYQSSFPVQVVNAAAFTNATVFVTAGGAVSLQLLTGAAFTLPMGPGYDINVSWNIGA